MNADFKNHDKDQQKAFEKGATRLREKLKEQKEADIKHLQQEYKAKTAQFRRTMEISIDYIDIQTTAKEELQK